MTDEHRKVQVAVFDKRLVEGDDPPTMEERIARLLQVFQPGDSVRADATILYGTGEVVPEGTIGHILETNVHGCTPLVTVAWDGLPPISHACSVEALVRSS